MPVELEYLRRKRSIPEACEASGPPVRLQTSGSAKVSVAAALKFPLLGAEVSASCNGLAGGGRAARLHDPRLHPRVVLERSRDRSRDREHPHLREGRGD